MSVCIQWDQRKREEKGETGLRTLLKHSCVTLSMCSTCAPMSPKSPEANERTHSAPWSHGRKLKTKPWCAVTLEGPSETAVGSVRGQRQPPRDPAARCPAATAAQPGVRTRTHLRPCWATHSLPTHVKVVTEMRVKSAFFLFYVSSCFLVSEILHIGVCYSHSA